MYADKLPFRALKRRFVLFLNVVLHNEGPDTSGRGGRASSALGVASGRGRGAGALGVARAQRSCQRHGASCRGAAVRASPRGAAAPLARDPPAGEIAGAWRHGARHGERLRLRLLLSKKSQIQQL